MSDALQCHTVWSGQRSRKLPHAAGRVADGEAAGRIACLLRQSTHPI